MHVADARLTRVYARLVYFYAQCKQKASYDVTFAQLCMLTELDQASAFALGSQIASHIEGATWTKNASIRVRAKTDGGERMPEAHQVFEYWQGVTGHKRAKFGARRTRAVLGRLKDGYTVEELKAAVDGCKLSPWHQGENRDKRVYDDLELICRDPSHVDRFIGLAAQSKVVSIRERMRRRYTR